MAVGTITAPADALSLSFEELPDEQQLAELLTVSLLYNDVTYRRLEATIGTPAPRRLRTALRRSAARCSPTTLEVATAAMAAAANAGQSSEPLAAERAFNRGLNDGQRRALVCAAASPLPHTRPPGTGKTTAVGSHYGGRKG